MDELVSELHRDASTGPESRASSPDSEAVFRCAIMAACDVEDPWEAAEIGQLLPQGSPQDSSNGGSNPEPRESREADRERRRAEMARCQREDLRDQLRRRPRPLAQAVRVRVGDRFSSREHVRLVAAELAERLGAQIRCFKTARKILLRGVLEPAGAEVFRVQAVIKAKERRREGEEEEEEEYRWYVDTAVVPFDGNYPPVAPGRTAFSSKQLAMLLLPLVHASPLLDVAEARTVFQGVVRQAPTGSRLHEARRVARELVWGTPEGNAGLWEHFQGQLRQAGHRVETVFGNGEAVCRAIQQRVRQEHTAAQPQQPQQLPDGGRAAAEALLAEHDNDLRAIACSGRRFPLAIHLAPSASVEGAAHAIVDDFGCLAVPSSSSYTYLFITGRAGGAEGAVLPLSMSIVCGAESEAAWGSAFDFFRREYCASRHGAGASLDEAGRTCVMGSAGAWAAFKARFAHARPFRCTKQRGAELAATFGRGRLVGLFEAAVCAASGRELSAALAALPRPGVDGVVNDTSAWPVDVPLTQWRAFCEHVGALPPHEQFPWAAAQESERAPANTHHTLESFAALRRHPLALKALALDPMNAAELLLCASGELLAAQGLCSGAWRVPRLFDLRTAAPDAARDSSVALPGVVTPRKRGRPRRSCSSAKKKRSSSSKPRAARRASSGAELTLHEIDH